MAGMAVVLLLALLTSGSAEEVEADPSNLRIMEAADDLVFIRSPLAPGYCPSSGGSTTYEYISGINYTRNPSGTMIITVEVFITNPTGCTYGNPCPEYDNSPEYVNAWVDWDGDGVFESHEKVIDEALTSYLGLNYYGTMTTSEIVTIPNGSANTTWLRVNLGWDYDPNDPCESSWTWGDVFDEQISTETELPQIEDIVVTGPPGDEDNPMTTYPVTLEAITSTVPGFVIDSISWSGDDIPSGATGSPYTYTPAAGTHGNKNVQCTITYEKTATAETGEDTMAKGYKLFFEKSGDEDSDGEPNWFEHWATDGAVPRLGEAYYDPAMVYYGCFGCTGTRVELGPSAAGQHYGSAIVLNTYFGTESFGGPSITGIDCASEVVAHEFYHKWVWQNWQSGGMWVGKTDSDQSGSYDDDLPDDYENTVSHTWNNDTDTYDLEHKKSSIYKYYGDQEYMAMRTGNLTKGNPAKDWANPGKQTNSLYDTVDVAVKSLFSMDNGPLKANFTGLNTEEGEDTDADGLYEYLTVTSELNVTTGGMGNMVAILKDLSGNQISVVNRPLDLSMGIQNITVRFDGVDVWNHGVNGSYNVSMVMSNEFDHPSDVDNQYFATSAYRYTDFQFRAAEFTRNYSELTVDTDSDKLYNYLIINVGTYVRESGEYTVVGWLYDGNETKITTTHNTTHLNTGKNMVMLLFSGEDIRYSRLSGPYYLRYLTLMEDGEQIDFILDAYSTDDYRFDRFQTREAELRDSYESWGKDPNKNKFYDYLTVAVGIRTYEPGKYTVLGDLYDEKGNMVGQVSGEKEFEGTGTEYIQLNFLGKDIFLNGMDGPYFLKHVSLIGENGIVDYQEDAHATSAYKVGMFRPLVMLAGAYKDEGEDADGNGLYDNLTVCAAVLTTDSGRCVLHARLVDQNGKEILWAKNAADVTGCLYNFGVDDLKSDEMKACIPNTICINFSGEYINANQEDGPYEVSDVFVYHTGDVFVPDYARKPAKTAEYGFTQFEKAGILTGVVVDSNGNPVPNSVVIIEGVDYDYADSHGKYLLTILKSGTYEVRADPPTGSELIGDSATITATVGEKVVYNFTLVTGEELKNKVYLNPDVSRARFCSTTTVEIWVDAADLKSGQIELLYDPNCAEVVNFIRNKEVFALGGWNHQAGREWITFATEKEGITGKYLVGKLEIHCIDDSCKCSTPFKFGDKSALFDPMGDRIKTNWMNGEFECWCALCGDVNCDGKVNMGDVILLLNHVTYGYSICDRWAADVNCDGEIDMGDVGLLHNYVTYKEYPLRCCELKVEK